MENLPAAIARGKELLRTVRHAAMATVNDDGSPHNTPYRFLADAELKYVYWASSPAAQHSKNIERTGKAFVVLFDANEKGGLYIALEEARALQDEPDLNAGIAVHNLARKLEDKPPIERKYYTQDEQRLYRAKPVKFWVYVSERDPVTKLVLKDERQEVSAKDLI